MLGVATEHGGRLPGKMIAGSAKGIYELAKTGHSDFDFDN